MDNFNTYKHTYTGNKHYPIASKEDKVLNAPDSEIDETIIEKNNNNRLDSSYKVTYPFGYDINSEDKYTEWFGLPPNEENNPIYYTLNFDYRKYKRIMENKIKSLDAFKEQLLDSSNIRYYVVRNRQFFTGVPYVYPEIKIHLLDKEK
jgi:hypothetical protein